MNNKPDTIGHVITGVTIATLALLFLLFLATQFSRIENQLDRIEQKIEQRR